MINIAELQKYIPNGMKAFLKPHYRKLFPNRLHMIFWITFQCNYRCSYCPIVTQFNYGKVVPRDTEKTADEWIEAFEKLPPTMIYISGGEPFLYRGLVDFLNGLPEKHQVLGIVTNLTQKTELYRQIRRKPHLNVSFHREFASDDKFIARVKELQDEYHICVNVVATPENLKVIEAMHERFEKERVALHVDPFIEPGFSYTEEQMSRLKPFLPPDRQNSRQWQFDDYETKICSAGVNYMNLLPDGTVVTCAGGMDYLYSPLVSNILQGQPGEHFDVSRFAMGNLFDPNFSLRKSPVACTLPCKAACDLDSVSIKRLPKSDRTNAPVAAVV
jgi:MoaA/NifB/PqqE/SkfB family radical SAM enzyme